MPNSKQIFPRNLLRLFLFGALYSNCHQVRYSNAGSENPNPSYLNEMQYALLGISTKFASVV